jgi:hypothetical protein
VTANYATAAIGLGGGIICGLALRGALVAVTARAAGIVTALGMLLATVFLMCGAAWTFFTEFKGHNGWLWLAAGIAVGVGFAEVAFRLGTARRIEVDLSQLRVLSWPVLALVLVAVLVTALAIAGQVQIKFPALGALSVQIGR